MNAIAPGLLMTLGLCALVAMAFIAPMLPALIELLWPTDAKPLRVVREHDSNVANFAHGFQQYVDSQFAESLKDVGATEVRSVPLQSGGTCVVMGKAAEFLLSGGEYAALTVKHLLVGAGDVRLPDNVLYEAEVFATGHFTSGTLSAFRAVLAQGDAVLGRGTVVLRWIHACKVLKVGKAAQLFGRASSDMRIALASGVTFERLHAPEIHFDPSSEGVPASAPQLDSVPRTVHDFALTHKAEMKAGVWHIAGDVELAAASLCTAALVVHGDLRAGAASRFQFPVKSNGDTVFRRECRADDAVVATGRIDIGPDCHIKGPVISEVEVLVRRGSSVGTATAPTTISAPRIVIEPGVVVFGSVWARQYGEVILEKAIDTP